MTKGVYTPHPPPMSCVPPGYENTALNILKYGFVYVKTGFCVCQIPALNILKWGSVYVKSRL